MTAAVASVDGPVRIRETDRVLTFALAGQRYGLPLDDVREVLRAVAITRLPGAPEVVEGVVDVRGDIIPAVDLRRRMGLPAKPIELSDHLIVANPGGRTMILRVDEVQSLLELAPGAVQDASALMPKAEYIAGIVRLPEGLVLIHDLLRFLSPAEESTLLGALANFSESRPGS